MTEGKGKCPHGEFDLRTGCPQCTAERENAEVNSPANIAERIKEAEAAAVGKEVPRIIVKVKYFSETTEELSAREYTYFTAEPLALGEVVKVPVRDTFGKAKVSTINVPEAEIENFKDKVKTIPPGSIIRPVQEEQRPELGESPEHRFREAVATDTALKEDAVYMALTNETALALRPGEDVEARGYFKEALELRKYAEARVITTVEGVKLATDDLSIIAKLKKVMENKRKAILDPLRLQADAIRETYSSLMDPVFRADRITREKILAFNQEQERIRLQQEDINRKRLEAAQQEAALNNGEITESVNLVEVTEAPAKSVSTEMGTSGQRDNWKWEVVDPLLVPREYMMIDTAMLSAIAKKHHDQKQIPGIRFYNEPIITVRAR